MSNQIFYISGNRKFYINENSGVLVLNNLDLRTNSRPTINGTGVLLSGEGATLPSTIVYTTGSQTIGGSKTFSSPAAFISGLFGTQIIGLNVTATDNIVLKNDLLQNSQASGYLTGIGYSGNYDGGYFLGRTKLSQNTSRLVDSSFGNSWVAKDSTRVWTSISISSDGKYQSAVANPGQIYVSSDYGNTWVAKESSRSWRYISISSDGKYQSAVVGDSSTSGQIYISSDYGNTWAAKESSRKWGSISISSDGKYQSAVVGDFSTSGQIYVSSDYGNTWVAKESSRKWISISISSDGKYQSAAVIDAQIYVSSDYGNTWVAKENNRTWGSISISSDGKYQSAVANPGQIYVSSDYGNTWVAKGSGRFWKGISISSDGKYQAANGTSTSIDVSSDYGNTWTTKLGLNTFWFGISISSNGKYISAISSTTPIYISKTDEQIDGNLYVDNIYGNNLVYTTGNQTISGVKTFDSRPTVGDTGVLLSGESILANQISNATTAGRNLLTGATVQAQRIALDIFVTAANIGAFPVNGNFQRVYIADDTSRAYAWNGSSYIEISSSVSSVSSGVMISSGINSNFSNLNGLTKRFETEWWNGVPTGWSGVNSNYTVYNDVARFGFNNYVANLGQLSSGASGNSFRQNLGRLPITSNVELTFTYSEPFSDAILNAAIYNGTYQNLATGQYTTPGTYTLTGTSIPANTNIIVGFWAGAGNPVLDNVSVSQTTPATTWIFPTTLPRNSDNLPSGALWVDTSAGNVLKIVL